MDTNINATALSLSAGLVSVDTLLVDLKNPVIQMNWIVFGLNYTYALTIKRGSNTILTIDGLRSGRTGVNRWSHRITSEQRTLLLKAMADTNRFEATYELTAYDGVTQIGDTSSVTAFIETAAVNSKPLFDSFGFADVNNKTLVLTENNQLLVQGQSFLRVTCAAAIPVNEATIVGYKVSIGSQTVYSETTEIDFGAVSLSGSLTITVSAVDSRGYMTTRTKTVQVIPYERIRLNYWFIRRLNDVEETANLVFDGEYSPVIVDGKEKNSLNNFIYRYRKIGDAWSGWNSVGMSYGNGVFAYNSTEFGWFDPDYTYEIQLSVSDRLTVSEIYLSLPKGIPLVAYRSKMVGINKMHPESALDVAGEIHQNGEGVLGFVGVLDADFDTIFTGGIYWYSAASSLNHAPSPNDGFLLVISFGSNVVHLFIDIVALTTIMRSYDIESEEWRPWYEK